MTWPGRAVTPCTSTHIVTSESAAPAVHPTLHQWLCQAPHEGPRHWQSLHWNNPTADECNSDFRTTLRSMVSSKDTIMPQWTSAQHESKHVQWMAGFSLLTLLYLNWASIASITYQVFRPLDGIQMSTQMAYICIQKSKELMYDAEPRHNLGNKFVELTIFVKLNGTWKKDPGKISLIRRALECRGKPPCHSGSGLGKGVKSDSVQSFKQQHNK